MAVTQSQAKNVAPSTSTEPIKQHLIRLATTALWVVAPIVAAYLLFGKFNSALSVLGGAVVSVGVFGALRVMVYKGLGLLTGGPEQRSMSMAQFALGSLAKFAIAAVLVWGMYMLHASMLQLLIGFVVAQIALAVTVSKGLKGPV